MLQPIPDLVPYIWWQWWDSFELIKPSRLMYYSAVDAFVGGGQTTTGAGESSERGACSGCRKNNYEKRRMPGGQSSRKLSVTAGRWSTSNSGDR